MNRRWWAGLIVLAAALGGLAWWSNPRPLSPRLRASRELNIGGIASAASSRVTPSPGNAERLDDFQARLTATADPQASRRILAALRSFLDTLPREVASREVLAFLRTKQDAATKLDVVVTAGGTLGDASSLRVFLLDYLGQIDRPAAADVGRQILGSPTSPDEWAVCLRNVAWADPSPASHAYLRAKAREMISMPAWRENPSAGFLEAFDVMVYAQAFDRAPLLSEFMGEKKNRAVAHAAFLTLDRLTMLDPAATLPPLAARPELMAGREQSRANLFARIDVRNPRQKALLESYLLDPRRSAEELQTFAGIFPNANYLISDNLLTRTAPPSQSELAARDRAALEVLEKWLSDAHFSGIAPRLESTRVRLREFVRQASAR